MSRPAANGGKQFWLELRQIHALREPEHQRQVAEDPAANRIITHWLFNALRKDCPENHRALDGGIAPVTWEGWRRCAPPLSELCTCGLIGINSARAGKLLATPGFFDLTARIPEGAGLDAGYRRPSSSIYGENGM